MSIRTAALVATLVLSIAAWQSIVGDSPTIWDHLVAALVSFLVGAGGATVTRGLR